MAGKQKKLSPARQRDAEANAGTEVPKDFQKGNAWAAWEKKVDRIGGRDLDVILHGWLAHIPEIIPPGCAPREGIGAIAIIDEVLGRVPESGDLVEELSGARSLVLHEAFYLAHKAVHVQASSAKAIAAGFHTWAVVDAYQASLFALSSILCFAGITSERFDNNFILIDVWSSDEKAPSKGKVVPQRRELYRFIKFRNLDHFHKWAILKRVLRTIANGTPLLELASQAIEHLDDKAFSTHRNKVHYESSGWLANDLVDPDLAGPIKAASSPQELFDGICAGTPSGTVFLMCLLVEVACEFANAISSVGALKNEKRLLDRRLGARSIIATFDWAPLVKETPPKL